MPSTWRRVLQWWSPSCLAWACAAAMALATLLGPLLGAAVAFRWAHLVLSAAAIVGWALNPSGWARPVSRAAWAALLTAALVWFEASTATHFLDVQVNGVDFSIFDWMLHSTAQGRPGWSPIYTVNHLGVHSSFLLLALVPLHALWPSPWWLLLTGPLVLWLGAFPLARLVRWSVGDHGGLLVSATLAYLACAWLAPVVHCGYRIEAMLPVLTLWFLVGWVEQRPMVTALSVVGLLLTKEDSAVFVAAFACAAFCLERPRRPLRAALVVVACVVWLGLYTQVLQPALAGRAPTYLGFWSDYGRSFGEVALGMLAHPLRVASRVASSGVWRLFLPALLVPWASPRAAAAMAPMVVLLGAASSEQMHQFGGYYGLPLVAFVLFGVLDVARRWGASSSTPRWKQGVPLLALTLFPLFHAPDVRVFSVDWDRLQGLSALRAALPADAPLCVQPILFAHVGYPKQVTPLFAEACSDGGAFTVVNLQRDPSPLTQPQLQALVDSLRQRRRVQEFPGGTLLIWP